MLMPKKTKFRKQHRGRMTGQGKLVGMRSASDNMRLQALEPAWITSRQIEAGRIAMTRHVRRGGKVWIRVFPDKPVSKKPAETRMGKGKGGPEFWVAVVRPGLILYEMDGVDESVAREAMRLASHKLPIATRFLAKM